VGWAGDRNPSRHVSSFRRSRLDDRTGRVQGFKVPVELLERWDLALLIGADLITEPRGRLLDEAHRKVTEVGWAGEEGAASRAPRADYSLDDLIECIDQDPAIRGSMPMRPDAA